VVVARLDARRLVGLAVLLSLFLVGLTVPVHAATPPAGSVWSQAWITTADGEKLHADILRPTGYNTDNKTPVILVVSPYIGESGGPDPRFNDFFDGAKVFERGYSVVMVSLRGTGGSTGCLDILGPGEQLDVVNSVEWAASQPWSTGKVGMYGKSYDGNTGVVGAALRPAGLSAVVAQEISPDRYRGSYQDRVRLMQSLLYPSATYGTQAEGQFDAGNEPDYIANSASRSADCQAGFVDHYRDDESSPFWRSRDFVDRAQGSTVPTFITTGYVDPATNIGAGAVDFYNALAGPKKLWIGWWDHVRGGDMVGNRLAMGRAGFYDEVMRFYDQHLKGIAPTVSDPVIAAQGSDGTWRSETAFPPADAGMYTSSLRSGSYVDDGRNVGSNDSAAGPGGNGSIGTKAIGAGAWTVSPPLLHRAQMTGIPLANVNVTPKLPNTNIAVNVYDIDSAGKATMITRGTALVDAAGSKKVTMWPTDWTFEPGHRVGVLVSGANAEAFAHVPTQTTVTVVGGTIGLPFVRYERPSDLAGDPAPRLQSWKQNAPFAVPAGTVEQRVNIDFRLPPPLTPRL
jgi:predicted acyl esterase